MKKLAVIVTALVVSAGLTAETKYGDMKTVTQDMLDRAALTVTISYTRTEITSKPVIIRISR